jgi:putative FmdB family regulatory protein
MPTYEYECETCGIHFDRWQRMTEDSLEKCPECEGPVHRVMHPVGIVFKGSGFYCTDHRSSSSTATPGKEKSEGKSETKLEKKEEAKPDRPERADKPEKKD